MARRATPSPTPADSGAPAAPAPSEPAADGLRRELNLFGAVSMIVGIVIGSGIFLGVDRVAAGAGNPSLIAAAWLLGGLLTLMGALCYAELGVLFPKAGGAYVFIRESIGRMPAFLLGWTTFTVNLAGSAAALAVVFAQQLNALKPLGFHHVFYFGSSCGAADPECLSADGFNFAFGSVKLTAVCLILLVATINWFGLRLGGNVQKGFTVMKGGLMVFLAAAALLWAGTPAAVTEADPIREHGFDFAQFFGFAMVGVFFAYDGWTNVVAVGSEVKNPARTFPRAMLLGILGVAALYLLLSFGYLNVLGFEGFANSDDTVATDAARVLFGNAGQGLVAAVILVSVFGSLNGITISGPRFYYAMARDGLFPRVFGETNRHHVPAYSIWGQAGLAILFLLFLNFNQLTDSIVFVSFFFYSLAAAGLIILRRKRPDLPRPYKVPFYPLTPIVYIVASTSFSLYQLYRAVTDFENAGYLVASLGVVGLGVPIYLFYNARLRRATASSS